MPSFNTDDLIKTLQQDVAFTIQKIEELQNYSDLQLLSQPDESSWCITQVIEHLNMYNRYYLKEITDVLGQASNRNNVFKSGMFGNYFTKMMAPKDEQVANKMKAMSDYSPVSTLGPREVINEFIDGQKQLIALLDKGKQADLTKLKASISLTRFIKLRLGDVFRFLIAHQLRHMVQIDKIESIILANAA